MTIIIGLGNPGIKYKGTRHNVGFEVLDRLAKIMTGKKVVFNKSNRSNCLTVKVGGVMLVKPLTFMNMSGECIKQLVDYYKVRSEDVWVLHDDIDLPLGKIRIRSKGSGGGHKGVMSIIEKLKSDNFIRFRLGVGRGTHIPEYGTDRNRKSVIQHVLSRFQTREAGKLKHLIKNGANAVRIAMFDGIDKAMNRYN